MVKLRKLLSLKRLLLVLLGLLLFGGLFCFIRDQAEQAALRQRAKQVQAELAAAHRKAGLTVESQLRKEQQGLVITSRLTGFDSGLARQFTEAQEQRIASHFQEGQTGLLAFGYSVNSSPLSGLRQIHLKVRTNLPDQTAETILSLYADKEGQAVSLEQLIDQPSAFLDLLEGKLTQQGVSQELRSLILASLRENLAATPFRADGMGLYLALPYQLPETFIAYPELYGIMTAGYLTGEAQAAYQTYLAEQAELQRQAKDRALARAAKSGGVIDQPQPAKKKVIALTFDDGPDSKTTPQVLKILKEHGIKGTFFILGTNVAGNEKLLREMAAAGHQLGNHTWSHLSLTKLPADKIRSEVAQTQEAIFKAAGIRPSVLRPPYGAYNSLVVQQAGLALVNWTVDTYDWKDRRPEAILEQVKDQAASGGIILLHDIHQTSVDALPAVIDYLKGEGYSFVTIDQLLTADQ